MQYDIIAIDVFNFFYRKKRTSLEKDPLNVARAVVSEIKDNIEQHLSSDGKMFLLYDPIPKSDMGTDKVFKYTERQKIVTSYKRNRTHDTKTLMTVHYVYKYFLHKGEKYVSVISSKYEADDYMESIVADYPEKKVLMVTTDNDWCRYLSSNVDMMNSSWENILTAEAFEKKYNFIPSITGICVWKACFGDGAGIDKDKNVKASAGSDNIKGALTIKNLKSANDVKLAAFKYVKWLGTHHRNINDVKNVEQNIMKLIRNDNRNPEEEFFFQIESLNKKFDVPSIFFQNLSVIQSRCDDYKLYASSKDIDDKYNKVIDKVLGFNSTSGANRQFKFGKIKG